MRPDSTNDELDDVGDSDATQPFPPPPHGGLPVIERKSQPVLLGVVYKTSLLDAYLKLEPTR